MSSDPDLFELNLAWLLKARELSQSNPDQATLLFGLDQHLSDALRECSLTRLRHLARSQVLLFRPRFDTRFWEETLAMDRPWSDTWLIQTLMLAADDATD